MLSTNLTFAEVAGFYTQAVVDTLTDCGLQVCQSHIAPSKPRDITCCPCSCSTRGGFTVTTWIDRVSMARQRSGVLRCPCISELDIGLQVGRCWPTVTKCDSAAQTEALDQIFAAMQCITEAICCGSLLEGISTDGRPMCEAVDPQSLVTLKSCDADEWFEGGNETCCAGFELVVTLR